MPHGREDLNEEEAYFAFAKLSEALPFSLLLVLLFHDHHLLLLHTAAAIFVIDSHHSLKWLDGVVQRMCALSDDHQLQSLVGMPLVILALGEEFMNENSAEVQHVTEVSNR